MSFRFYLFLILLNTLSIQALYATHLRAADITVTRVGDLTYDILLTTFTDFESVIDGGGQVSADTAIIYINNEYLVLNRSRLERLNDNTFKNEYLFQNYKLTASNINVSVFYIGDNRNGGVININNGVSDQQRIYVETIFNVSNFTPINSTPILATPPIDIGAVDQLFVHNPGAWDPDGDSLSFEIIASRGYEGTPKTQANPNANGTVKNLSNYQFLDDPAFGVGVQVSIDPVTGTLIWNSPKIEGEYNIAIQVNEWRNGERIGYVIRDMQINIEESDNEPPKIFIPKDTCIASGSTLKEKIFTNDEDRDNVTLSAFGGPIELGSELSVIKPIPTRPDTIIADFQWKIPCEAVREEPHFAVFKALDNGQPNLSDLKNWAITVIGAAPTGLTGTVQEKNVNLQWNSYVCSGSDGREQVDSIFLWRRSCDTISIKRSPCTAGVPLEWGFEKIATLAPNATTFLDDNNGIGLSHGINYHYLLSAVYNFPGDGESYASDVFTIDLGVEEPLMTKVSVLKTDEVDGEIQVDWIPPLNMDTAKFKGNYTYNLYQSLGFENLDFDVTPIFTFTTDSLKDSTFTVKGLNTLDTAFSYFVELLDEKEGRIGQTTPVSSVRLLAQGLEGAIGLDINYNTPWFYADTLYQVIYQDSAGVLTPIDSVQGKLENYTVGGLESNVDYCFVIETKGIYCLDTLGDQIIRNFSNRSCATPQDNVAPCPPITTLENPVNCADYTYSPNIFNTITWKPTLVSKCDTAIAKYNIYFKESLEAEFTLLTTVTTLDALLHIHSNLDTYVGCYAVTALDKTGNESGFSNMVCNDNCPDIQFPNVLTLNGDGLNEEFTPIPFPRFVKAIKFSVYNRWGELIHYSEDNPNLDWDGRSIDGNLLTDGVYFYSADVLFDRLNKEEASQLYKGWIYIVR